MLPLTAEWVTKAEAAVRPFATRRHCGFLMVDCRFSYDH